MPWLSLILLGTSSAPDAIYTNARVYTVRPNRVAEAFAVRGERFIAVGSRASVLKLRGPGTQVIDLKGRAVVPGFFDSHLHPSALFDEMSVYGRLDCGPARNPDMETLIRRLAEKASKTPAGVLVTGRGYEETTLGRHPTREDLDRASTTHPIVITHSSGHVGAANSLALRLAKVDRNTPNPPGSAFDRDPSGEPNGVLREGAQAAVRSACPAPPEPDEAATIEGYLMQFDQFLARGITSITIAGTSASTLAMLRKVHAVRPQVRIHSMLRGRTELADLWRKGVKSDDWFQIGAIKQFHGNSLSGQTCWVSKPYVGRPDYFGIKPAKSQKDLNRDVAAMVAQGMQVCTHANGDLEIDAVLTAYEFALQQHPNADHRLRIEHGSIMPDAELQRAKKLGVVIAPHSYLYEHGGKMEAYGPERFEILEPNARAYRLGVIAAGNSDYPVSAAWPMLRIQSLMTRRSKEGKVYGTRQELNFDQALHSWTWASAYAAFREKQVGSIEAGKLADFVVLNRDPKRMPGSRMSEVEVDETYVSGRRAFIREARTAALLHPRWVAAGPFDSAHHGDGGDFHE